MRTRPPFIVRCWWISVAVVALLAPLSFAVVVPTPTAEAADERPPLDWAEVLETPGSSVRFWATNVAVGDDGTAVVAAGRKVFAYAPDGTRLWSNQIGADPRDVAVDTGGNVVVVGAIDEPGTFGKSGNEVTLTPPKDPGKTYYHLVGFMAKYDSSGKLLWARMEGSKYVYPEAVLLASDGGIITSGGIDSDYSDVVLGSGSNAITLEGTGAFVATYSASGDLQDAFAVVWNDLQFFPVVDEPKIIDLEFAPSGDVVLAGTRSSTFTYTVYGPFGDPLWSETSGVGRMFLASATLQGTVNWATTTNLEAFFAEIGSFHGVDAGVGGMAVDSDGNIVVTGSFKSETCASCVITFGNGAAAVDLESDYVDAFVASYGPDGTLNWAQKVGGSGEHVGSDVAATSDGTVLVAGRFGFNAVDATFGEGQNVVTLDVVPGRSEMAFLAEYQSDGSLLWAARDQRRDTLGRTILNGDTSGPRIAVGPSGEIVVNDILEESITIGEGDTTVVLTPTESPQDIYLARYAAAPGGAVPPFVSLEPERFANSKNTLTFDGQYANTGPVAAGTFWKIKIADRGGVPASAIAAIMNVTATGSANNGNLRVYPCTAEVPTVSSINFVPGSTEPNEVIAKLSATGHVCVYASATVHVLVDVVGYVDAGSPYTPIDPARYANSKNTKTFDGQYANTGPVAAGTFWKIKMADRGAIPATATAVVANVTVTGPEGNGNLRVYPCTPEVPGASSLNYTPGLTRPNEVVAKLSDDGYLCVWTKATAHVIVDAVGYIKTTPGYTPVTPTRYAHSANTTTFDGKYADTGPIAGGTFWKIQIAGRGIVPAQATTVVANVTVTGPEANGNLRVYPCTAEVPGASSLNYTPGMTRPNEVIAKLSDTGHLCIWTKATTDIIVDVVGHNG